MRLTSLFCLLVLAAAAPCQVNQKAENLVKDIQRTVDPAFDASRGGDAAYVKSHRSALRQAIKKRGELIFALFREEALHPYLMEALPKRWQEFEMLAESDDQIPAVYQQGIQEIEKLLEPPRHVPVSVIWPQEDWNQMCRFWIAHFKIRLNLGNWPAMLAAANEYIADVPGWLNSHVEILTQAAFLAPTPQQAAEAYRIAVQKYPTDPLTPVLKGFLTRIEGVGQPLSITFTDLVAKKSLSTDAYKGSFVLIDFFNSKSKKTEARVKALQDLKAAYGSKGLVIVSICLDEAKGSDLEVLKDKLTAWAKAAKVDWPVAAAGERARPDYITGWAITAMPDSFLIDKEGRLLKLGPNLNLEREMKELFRGA